MTLSLRASDESLAEAERLLPCNCRKPDGIHHHWCHASYRPDIALALDAREAKGRREGMEAARAKVEETRRAYAQGLGGGGYFEACHDISEAIRATGEPHA